MPKLAYNLLSVGQLMNAGYKVEFSNRECTVSEIQTNTQVARISMMSHRLFPLDANDVHVAHVI